MPPIWFKRAYRGLYANRKIGFGNQVSHAGNKKRRSWKPNVQKTTLYSETLGEKFPTQATTHAMRCIRKAGGLDEYLLKVKDSEIKNRRALRFKQRIIDARKQKLNGTLSASPADGGNTGYKSRTPAAIIARTPVSTSSINSKMSGKSRGLAEL